MSRSYKKRVTLDIKDMSWDRNGKHDRETKADCIRRIRHAEKIRLLMAIETDSDYFVSPLATVCAKRNSWYNYDKKTVLWYEDGDEEIEVNKTTVRAIVRMVGRKPEGFFQNWSKNKIFSADADDRHPVQPRDYKEIIDTSRPFEWFLVKTKEATVIETIVKGNGKMWCEVSRSDYSKFFRK